MSGESKAKLSQFIQVFFGKHCSESKNKSETNFLIFNIDYILRLKLITVFMFMFHVRLDWQSIQIMNHLVNKMSHC